MKSIFIQAIIKITPIWAIILSVLLSSCGTAQGGDYAQVEEIPAPAGIRCFAIQDSNGKTVAGNCIKD